MIRSVNQVDSVKAWKVYLNKNCAQQCSADEPKFGEFLALIQDANSGDSQTYVFDAGALTLLVNGKRIGEVTDAVVIRTVLESWIGREPTTEELKKSLLRGN